MALPFFHTMSSFTDNTLVLVETRVPDVASEWTTEVIGLIVDAIKNSALKFRLLRLSKEIMEFRNMICPCFIKRRPCITIYRDNAKYQFKYLGFILDKKWQFYDHFSKITFSIVILKGPNESRR